jgi:hypothetical protein
VRLEGLGKLKKANDIANQTRDLPVCSIVPQPTTLPRAPYQQMHELFHLKITIFWNVMQSSLVDTDKHFKGMCCTTFTFLH